MGWLRIEDDYDRSKWLRSERQMVKDAWVNLLRLVHRESPRKGSIRVRDIDDLAYAMRYADEDSWAIHRLIEVALKDVDGKGPAVAIDGESLSIVNWKAYQESDAAERMRRYREKQGLPPEQTVTPEDSYVTKPVVTSPLVACDPEPCTTEQEVVDKPIQLTLNQVVASSGDRSRGVKTSRGCPEWQSHWKAFCDAYPKRSGSLARSKAEPIFRRLVANGERPDEIVQGAKDLARWAIATSKVGTDYVPMMTTYLNQRRWTEELTIPAVQAARNAATPIRAEEDRKDQIIANVKARRQSGEPIYAS